MKYRKRAICMLLLLGSAISILQTQAINSTTGGNATGRVSSLRNFPTFDQDTAGNEATGTINANLAGRVPCEGNETIIVTNVNLRGEATFEENANIPNSDVIGVLTGFTSGARTRTRTRTGTAIENILQSIQNLRSNAASIVHTIGESYGGGVVFYVTIDGMHGLVAATQDQSSATTWYEAQNNISNPKNHNTEGKKYTDWRLPTKYELNLLYLQKTVVGSFANNGYWSSSENYYNSAWAQNFSNGSQVNGSKVSIFSVRAVRSF
jgi:Protein of unknown function (DUF1566)